MHIFPWTLRTSVDDDVKGVFLSLTNMFKKMNDCTAYWVRMTSQLLTSPLLITFKNEDFYIQTTSLLLRRQSFFLYFSTRQNFSIS